MPIVMRSGGFTVHIFLPLREHPPPHVHVRTAGEECVVTLNPLGLAQHGMSRKNTRDAMRLVSTNAEFLMAQWMSLHD